MRPAEPGKARGDGRPVARTQSFLPENTMHTRIPYTDPFLELLDCVEDAVQLLAFDYFAAALDELRRARALVDGALASWCDEDAELARAWLQQAEQTQRTGAQRERRGLCAGALWRVRRAVRRHWLAQRGVAWDPYDAALDRPGRPRPLRLVDDAGE